MSDVQGAYCATGDMRTGDIATPSYTTKEQYVKSAAEEIEVALGHLYVTPFVLTDTPENRPAKLWLKKLNWLLASGRMLLDVAAAAEDTELHALGKRYLDEAFAMITPVVNEDIVLVGAPKIEGASKKDSFVGPQIHNEDSSSMVEGFYRNRRPGAYGYEAESYPFGHKPPVVPYG